MKKSSNIIALITCMVLLCTGPMVWGHGVGRQPESRAEVGQQPQMEAEAVHGSMEAPEAGNAISRKAPKHGKGSQANLADQLLTEPSSGESAVKPSTENVGGTGKKGAERGIATVKDITKRENSDTLYFVMGFLLGFIGVIAAYFMSNHDKRAVKWSAIGFGVSILLGVVALVALLGIASAPLSAL